MSGEAIVTRDLVKRFGNFVAVGGISFAVAKGEIMGFIGPNGAGKSTTIRMLCGLLRPSGGTALVGGVDVAKAPEQVRQHIGYMSQKFSLYGDLTVAENLRFFGGIYRVPKAELAERMAYAVTMAGLAGRENALVSDLAGGWKQRLALGCAILHRPPILFLDEPTSGVDPMSRRRFWDLIHDMAAGGVTILVTTHYMDEAEYCDRIAMIDAGHIGAMGSPNELKHLPLGGTLLVVTCDRVGEAMAILGKAPGVRDVAAFGNALHVLADAGVEPQSLAAMLAGHGIAGATVSPIAPGLEDVFVKLAAKAAT